MALGHLKPEDLEDDDFVLDDVVALVPDDDFVEMSWNLGILRIFI